MTTIKEYLNSGKLEYIPGAQTIFILNKSKGDLPLCDIRGWGHIQYMFPTQQEAVEFQDSIGKFIEEAIKEKLEKL